jgi:basic membrane protein A
LKGPGRHRSQKNAIEAGAKKNPSTRFLLIDSPILDERGTPYALPNVRTVTFRENEGTFLVGAVAGLVTRSNVVGFVGGMQSPLIRKFEAGFRAGVLTTNPVAGRTQAASTGWRRQLKKSFIICIDDIGAAS